MTVRHFAGKPALAPAVSMGVVFASAPIESVNDDFDKLQWQYQNTSTIKQRGEQDDWPSECELEP